MSTDNAGAATGDECTIAMQAAMGVALDHCTDEETLQINIGRILGVEPDRDCETALDEGLDTETCGDMNGIRQWVTCRAHQLLMTKQMSFDDAMEQAWTEAHQQCDMGGSAL